MCLAIGIAARVAFASRGNIHGHTELYPERAPELGRGDGVGGEGVVGGGGDGGAAVQVPGDAVAGVEAAVLEMQLALVPRFGAAADGAEGVGAVIVQIDLPLGNSTETAGSEGGGGRKGQSEKGGRMLRREEGENEERVCGGRGKEGANMRTQMSRKVTQESRREDPSSSASPRDSPLSPQDTKWARVIGPPLNILPTSTILPPTVLPPTVEGHSRTRTTLTGCTDMGAIPARTGAPYTGGMRLGLGARGLSGLAAKRSVSRPCSRSPSTWGWTSRSTARRRRPRPRPMPPLARAPPRPSPSSLPSLPGTPPTTSTIYAHPTLNSSALALTSFVSPAAPDLVLLDSRRSSVAGAGQRVRQPAGDAHGRDLRRLWFGSFPQSLPSLGIPPPTPAPSRTSRSTRPPFVSPAAPNLCTTDKIIHSRGRTPSDARTRPAGNARTRPARATRATIHSYPIELRSLILPLANP
ncbi:hypothetical protein C8F04DRAFT_1180759 [Mycena alexandri]|uniref:Uncharacterized protein n=1 Tax=Mycena alexandri TaxID=1745969 RepID=A0AAD6T0C8_9AGAR|nr:hypothetical protein C8F04DRAFT_1180759 [Mycena alexandri]